MNERVPVSKEQIKKALQKLLETYTIEEISKRIGKDEEWIRKHLA